MPETSPVSTGEIPKSKGIYNIFIKTFDQGELWPFMRKNIWKKFRKLSGFYVYKFKCYHIKIEIKILFPIIHSSTTKRHVKYYDLKKIYIRAVDSAKGAINYKIFKLMA